MLSPSSMRSSRVLPVLPVLLAALSALVPRTAAAQTPAAQPVSPWRLGTAPTGSPTTPPEASPAATPEATPDEDERRRIDQSATLIAQGRPAEALHLLQTRLRPPQESPYATVPVLSRVARLMLGAEASGPTLPPPPATPDGSRSGAEAFSLYSTLFLYGVGTGIYVDVMAEIDDVRAAVWVPILLAGAGIGAAYYLDHPRPLRTGRGYGLSTGLTLGFAAGIALAYELDERNAYGSCTFDPITFERSCPAFSEGRGVATTVWLTGTVGMAAGYALAASLQPDPASMAFVNAAGLYGGIFGVMTLGVFEARDGYGMGWLLGEGVGIGLGAVLASTLHPTESQTRWSSLGVLAGGLLGVGVAVLGSDAYSSASAPLLITQLGMIGGGIGGYFIGDSRAVAARTARRGSDRFAASAAVMPVPGGATVGLSFPNLL